MLSPEHVLNAQLNAANENINYFEFPHKLENGDIRTVEVHSSPIEYNQKRILFSIIHDITKRKQSEQALKKSEANFKLLFNFNRAQTQKRTLRDRISLRKSSLRSI